MLKEGIILGERYEIISRVGSGGMADVYKARDHKLNRMVAVKVLKAEFREDTGFVTKFQKEAQSAARLSHPNVVNVFDVGEDRGLYYIVMELIEGITLKNYIQKKGKLSVREATSIAIQVSLGLEAAHNRGIIHRDVKPQNIIISTDGKVKLSDFGIAKATNSNTITANVMGSVHYSSPEQVRGGFSDAKSDIYSLGITMYEMVTGRVPFDGESTVAIAIKHLQEEMVAPSRYTPDLPYSLEQIILKCTQKNPERRYNRVGDLIEDLKNSLLDPQGNFVTITPLSSATETLKVSDKEVDEIRRELTENGGGRRGGRTGSLQRDTDTRERRKKKEIVPDDEQDEELDEEAGTGLEKAVTIGGFVIGAVIILILILVLGNMAGIFNFGKDNKTESSSAGKQTASEQTQTGDNQVIVPGLLGKTLADATAETNKMGIGVKQTGSAPSDLYEEGLIISQNINENTLVDKGTTIEVIISSGKADVVIPTGLSGATQAEAQNILDNLGLQATVELIYDDKIAVGNVVYVDPAEGTEVAPGADVKIYVSKGEDVNQTKIKVPKVVGRSLETAAAMLDSVGLNYTTVTGEDSSKQNGYVLAVSPEVGEAVYVGSQVTLTINEIKTEETPAPEPGEDAEPTTEPTAPGTGYVCNSPLAVPDGYNGGTVRLELVQDSLTSIIYEGANPWEGGALYAVPIRSASATTGVINVYEDDKLIARYNGVVFEAE